MNNLALIHRREGDNKNYMVKRLGKPKKTPKAKEGYDRVKGKDGKYHLIKRPDGDPK